MCVKAEFLAVPDFGQRFSEQFTFRPEIFMPKLFVLDNLGKRYWGQRCLGQKIFSLVSRKSCKARERNEK